MNISNKIGLRIKIMGLVITPVVIITLVFGYLYIQNSQVLKSERDLANSIAHTIAFESTIPKQQQNLEKLGLNVLNTDESISFLQDTTNADAKMILDGLFLSLKEEKIIRFIIYNSSNSIVLQHVNGVKERDKPLPSNLTTIYQQAAQDFTSHYYFRGSDNSSEAIATEYCIVMAISDDDDNIIGYLELAIDSKIWLSEIGALTKTTPILYDPILQDITLANDAKVKEQLIKTGVKQFSQTTLNIDGIESEYLALDVLPLLGGDNVLVGELLLVKDATEIMLAEKYRYWVALGACLLVILISQIIVYLVVSKAIVNPIKKVIGFAAQMAEVDMSYSLDFKAGGEIRDMAEALKKMSLHVQRRSKEAEAIAEGNLPQHIKIQTEKDVLGKSLRAITTKLGNIIDGIKQQATTLTTTSHTVASLSENLQDSTDAIGKQTIDLADSFATVRNSLKMVARATEQMSASIQEISLTTAENNRISTDTKSHSDNSAEVMENLSGAVSRISAANHSISDFADQTDLLALNATIEAARAGDAGKGFAVVASEVKDLASQSMQTAKKVSSDIGAVEKLTKEAMSTAKDIGNAIETASLGAQGIASAVEEQAAVASGISENVAGAFTATETFSESVNDINNSVGENIMSAQSLAEFSVRLETVAEELTGSIEMFQTEAIEQNEFTDTAPPSTAG